MESPYSKFVSPQYSDGSWWLRVVRVQWISRAPFTVEKAREIAILSKTCQDIRPATPRPAGPNSVGNAQEIGPDLLVRLRPEKGELSPPFSF